MATNHANRGRGRRSPRLFIHQIFYDQATRARLEPGYLPLDNTENLRPDWYEFWVMLKYLRGRDLDNDAWYGFLSPRFRDKTGYDAKTVFDIVRQSDTTSDVVLLSHGWDQIAYFLNVFEQGEVWHPGITRLARQFLDHIGFAADLSTMVMHSTTAVLSNQVVAKARYWREWRAIAEKFWDYVEHDPTADPLMRGSVAYGTAESQAPFKAFVQERLASIVLATGRFRVNCADASHWAPIYTRLFHDDPGTRQALRRCDLLKQHYTASGDVRYLQQYHETRRGITLRVPDTSQHDR